MEKVLYREMKWTKDIDNSGTKTDELVVTDFKYNGELLSWNDNFALVKRPDNTVTRVHYDNIMFLPED